MSNIVGYIVLLVAMLIFAVLISLTEFSFNRKKKSVKEMKDKFTESELEGTVIFEDSKGKEDSIVDIAEFRSEILCKLDKERMKKYGEYRMTMEQAFYINGLEYAIKIINEYDNKPKQYFTIE